MMLATTIPLPPSSYADQAPAPNGPERGFAPKRWAHNDGLYWGSPETCNAIEPGFYTSDHLNGLGFCLRRMRSTTDNLLRLPDPICDMLLSEFSLFWERASHMSARGLTAKRGILLYGPPGSGKTSAVQLMSNHIIKEMGGVAVFVGHPQVAAGALQLLRGLEPSRPLILLYEDIDAMVDVYGEASLLALLDGELQIANVVNVATTNYPERLDPRFTNRPGRFDRISLVGFPLPEARDAYFKAKAPELSDEQRARWVDVSDQWSLAHLRELVVAHLELGEPEDVVIERLQTMHDQLPKSDDARDRKFGFGGPREMQAYAARNVAGVAGRRGGY